MAVDDLSLVQRAVRGDRGAFDQLVNRYFDRIVVVCARDIPSQEDAQGVAQEVFLRAWNGLRNFRGESGFYTWLYRIARNEVSRYHAERKRTPRSVSLETLLPSLDRQMPSVDPQSRLIDRLSDREVITRLFEAARQGCNETEYQILGLFYQGHALMEIADLLQLKAAAVRNHFLRARLKLMAYLFQHDLELLGGFEAVHAAYRCALGATNPSHRLTAREAEVFCQRVLNKERKRWVEKIFRRACLKVARFL